jgi:hypothetical protein
MPKLTKCDTFHFTPIEIAKELMKDIQFKGDDCTLEPCRGDDAFYDLIPFEKDWCEIDKGRDLFKYKFDRKFTKIITNPPYITNHKKDKDRKNIFVKFIFKCLELCNGECWFLLNHAMWNSFTPRRLKIIKEMGFNLCFMRVLNIKKWWGRYYWICFSKNKTSMIKF